MKNNGKKGYQFAAEFESISRSVHDITALLNGNENGAGDDQATNDLRTSELRYRRLFEAAQDGILLLDAGTGAITDVNPYLTKLLGYEGKELIGKRLWEIGAFIDAAANEAGFKELRRMEYIRYDDMPLQTKAGQSRQVEFISNVYLVDGTKVIQCNIRDITDRKHAEKALEQSEKQYRRIVETANEGVWVIDKEDRTTLVNKRLQEMLGYTAEEMMGKTPYEFMDEEGSAIAEKSLVNRRSGINEQLDFKYIRKDGSTLWALIKVSSILDQGHEYAGALAMLTDITERKRTERELVKLWMGITHSSDAIFMTDRDGIIQYVNPSFERIYGYQSNEAVGQTPRILKSEMNDPSFYRQLWDTLTRGTPIPTRSSIKKKAAV